MELWVLWLIIIFILIVAEVSTVNLVSVWFIASGLVSLILSFFITRKVLIKLMKAKDDTKTNLDRILDSVAVVTEPILKNEVGEVKVEGKRWSAISSDELEIGDEVIIEKIDGVKLIVRKKEK